MFQKIAPTSAPNTTYWSMISASMMPLPMVVATFNWNTNSAMKLNAAAMATA